MAGARLVGGGVVELTWLGKRWAEQDDEQKELMGVEFLEVF